MIYYATSIHELKKILRVKLLNDQPQLRQCVVNSPWKREFFIGSN